MPSIQDSSLALPELDEDIIDNLLYDARSGDLPSLTGDLSDTKISTSASTLTVLLAAVDETTGNTCLHYAAANGHLDILQYLAGSVGAPSSDFHLLLFKQNMAGNTPLHYAAVNGQLSVVKFLLDSTSSDVKAELVACQNQAGHDAAFEAEGNGKDEVVAYLLGVLDVVEGKVEESTSAERDEEEEIGGDIAEASSAGVTESDQNENSGTKDALEEIKETLRRTGINEGSEIR